MSSNPENKSPLIDPLVSLAFSIYSNKGIYALLLGSGLSSSAGIPTGWDITKDLISRVADLYKENCEADPIAWFTKKFAAEPTYSGLLKHLAHSPAERRQIISNYIEPTAETEGLRVPTAAHKSIAQLVKAGYIKIIATTNFDRLIEQALSETGITPTVISSTDNLQGAIPIQHTGCTIIKLNGDYLDTRIKNSESELSKYDDGFDSLMDRVLDEYGLIVAGWSADWDTALRNAIERSPNHRFSTYWTTRNVLKEKAQKIVTQRRARVVQIKDADSFFADLKEKVFSLEQVQAQHPLSKNLAITTVKKYLTDDRFKIALNDLVSNETELVISSILSDRFPIADALTKEEFLTKMNQLNSICEVLISILIIGSRWGAEKYSAYWMTSLKRLANVSTSGNGMIARINMRLYPALLSIYAMGIGFTYEEKYRELNWMLAGLTARDTEMNEEPMTLHVSIWHPFRDGVATWLKDNHKTPISDYLFEILRPMFREWIPDELEFAMTFDRFEYLSALINVHTMIKNGKSLYPPMGRFIWRNREWGEGRTIMKDVDAEIQKMGVNWPPLLAGLFEGTIENYNAAKNQIDEILKKPGW